MPELDLTKEHPSTGLRVPGKFEMSYTLVGDEEPIGFNVPGLLRSWGIHNAGLLPKHALQVLNPLAYHRFHIEHDLVQPLRLGVVFTHNFPLWSQGMFTEPALMHVLFWETQDSRALVALKQLPGNIVIASPDEKVRAALRGADIDSTRIIPSIPALLDRVRTEARKAIPMSEAQYDEARKRTHEFTEEFHRALHPRKALPFSPLHVNVEQIGQLLGDFSAVPWENLPNDHDARPAALADTFNALRNALGSVTDFKVSGRVFSGRFPSAILAFPSINPQLRQQMSEGIKEIDPAFRDAARDLVTARIAEQDSTTYRNEPLHFVGKAGEAILAGISELATYTHFFDTLGYLHGSFEIGPYLRAPVKGASLASEQSFFSPKNFAQHAPDKSIAKRVRRFGQTLTNTLHPQLRQALAEYPGEVVGISDLPLEWINIDGVPLCFARDVSRIPETVISNVMSQFARNSRSSFEVTKDTPARTLVVCGAPAGDGIAENFDMLVELNRRHEIKTACRFERCHSRDHFYGLVKEFRPEFLIVDSHGRFVANETGTELMIGDEQLTGDDVIANLPQIPLVMLSTCWGAPLYGCSNTIAHAFFETGSYAVTTSFLPLNVQKGGVLYTRVVRNLEYAVEHPVHRNWASFVSHNVRTSFFDDLMTRAIARFGSEELRTADAYANKRQVWQMNTMSTERRAAAFRATSEIVAACFPSESQGKVRNLLQTSSYLPEFMFYTTLGRADLVKFASWRKVKHSPAPATIPIKDVIRRTATETE